jgi:hypothetical protein
LGLSMPVEILHRDVVFLRIKKTANDGGFDVFA